MFIMHNLDKANTTTRGRSGFGDESTVIRSLVDEHRDKSAKDVGTPAVKASSAGATTPNAFDVADFRAEPNASATGNRSGIGFTDVQHTTNGWNKYEPIVFGG
jgi:hypothetical protein